MKVIQFSYPFNESFNEDITLCLGFFDGVHLGHKYLIETAKNEGYKVGVLTFDVSPSYALGFFDKNQSITPLTEKIDIFNNLGVDYVFVMAFDNKVASISKDQFVNEVLKKINPKVVVCGEDYSFGKNKEGTPKYLNEFFKTIVVPFKTDNGQKISSRSIYSFIKNGEIESANQLLGRDYSIKGIVEKGLQNGSKIGFPTANISANEYVMPKDGVYAGRAIIEKQIYDCLICISSHPTIQQLKKSIIEVYVLELDKNIYGKQIEVKFVKKIRDIIKFKSLNELKEQITKDIAYIKLTLQ